MNIQTNIHTLFHINDLFRLRWDPAVLACLAEQPWHRRGLATTLGHRVGDRVETTSITRSLDRLCLNGLATVEHTRNRRSRSRLYRITDLGRTRLGAYQAIARAYDAHPIAAHRREATGVHTLILIADLFRFRWDPAVLACLAEQPRRNGALARTLGLRVGDRVEDNTLYRSLGRLRRGGLVTAEQIAAAGHNVPIYRITSHGRTLHDLYHAIAAGYPAPPAAQPTTAPATTADIDWSAAPRRAALPARSGPSGLSRPTPNCPSLGEAIDYHQTIASPTPSPVSRATSASAQPRPLPLPGSSQAPP